MGIPMQAGVALAVLLLPTALAAEPGEDPFCIVVIEPLDDFRLVRVSVDEELNATTQAEFWALADANHDNALTRAEAEAFRQGQLRIFPGEMSLGPKALLLTATPSEPRTVRAIHATSWRQVGHGYYAHQKPLEAVTSSASLETQEIREYSFRTPADATHVLIQGGLALSDTELAVYPTEPGAVTVPPVPPPNGYTNCTPGGVSCCDENGSCAVEEFVTVKAPPGWRIAHVQGHSYGTAVSVDVDAATYDLPAFDTKSPFTITYVKEAGDDRGSPLAAPWPLLGVLVAALALARLRRP
jgi:hypothetical protein